MGIWIGANFPLLPPLIDGQWNREEALSEFLTILQDGTPEREYSLIRVVDVNLTDGILFQKSEGGTGTANVGFELPAAAEVIEVDHILQKIRQAGFPARVSKGADVPWCHVTGL